MKKLLSYILSGIGILLLVVLCLFVFGVNLYAIGAFFIRVTTYIGNGSIVRGIICTPFFIFGIVQITRSFLMLGNKVQEEAQEGLFRVFSKKTDRGFDFGGLYTILTFVCYLLVFFIIAKPIN